MVYHPNLSVRVRFSSAHKNARPVPPCNPGTQGKDRTARTSWLDRPAKLTSSGFKCETLPQNMRERSRDEGGIQDG